jgi:hypothetical protein
MPEFVNDTRFRTFLFPKTAHHRLVPGAAFF